MLGPRRHLVLDVESYMASSKLINYDSVSVSIIGEK